MIITASVGGRGYVKSSCAVTRCWQEEGEDPRQGAAEVPPGDAGALLAEGDASLRIGDLAGAVQWWRRAAQAAPEMPEPYARISYAHLLDGDYEGGCEVIDHGLRAAPGADLLHLAKAECALYRGRLREVRQEAGRLVSKADFRTGALLLDWLAASLEAGVVTDCSAFARALGQLDEEPQWDLDVLVIFLLGHDSPAAFDLADALGILSAEGTLAAPRLAGACGG